MAPCLLHILFSVMCKTKVEDLDKLEEPKDVIQDTDEYRRHNDVYLEFQKERLEKVEPDDDGRVPKISVATAYSIFKDWFADSYGKAEHVASKLVFNTEMSKNIGEPDEKLRWVGYKMKAVQTEDEEVGVADGF
jgi:hypothetical protein